MSAAEKSILLPLRAIPGSLLSFEALLVLYMFAGIYKGDPRFAVIPVDPTALFFALSVVVGGFIIVRNPIHRKSLPVVFAMVCLVVWLLVSLTWSPSRIYGPSKVFHMATLVLWAVIAGAMIIAPDPERVRRLFTVLLLFSLWLGVECLLIFIAAGGNAGRIRVLGGGGYLALGRIAGLGALIALTAWLYGRGSDKWIGLTTFAFLAFVLAIAGGRGPVLAVALSMLVVAGLGIRFTRTRILYWTAPLSVLVLFLTVAAGLIVYSTVTEQKLASLERVERLLGGDIGGTGGNTRADIWAEVPTYVSEAPLLGNGAGSWPVIRGRPDQPSHPHNLFAELWVDGGLVALALFLVVLAVTFQPASFARLRSDPQALCGVMLFANTFLNAMVSADLPGNRAIFLVIGLLALFAVRPSGAAARVGQEVAQPSGLAPPFAVMRTRRLDARAKAEP